MATKKSRPPAPDQEHRDKAVAERKRNVLLDAGAGTGKTTILIDRLVRLLAPVDEAKAIPIRKIAAVTFTRRAAGDLRLRLREKLLSELAQPGLSASRRDSLRAALDGVDAAYVGTIHSFADRLLRLHTVEAGLSPSYEVVENADELVRETLGDLLHGVQTGTLPEMLRGTGFEGRAGEATEAVRNALAAGIPIDSRESRHRTTHGLRDLVAGFANRRDVPPNDPKPKPFDAKTFGANRDEFLALVEALPADPSPEGIVWLRSIADLLREVRDLADPAAVYRAIEWPMRHAPNEDNLRKRDEFEGDAAGFEVWKIYARKQTGANEGAPALRDEILKPFQTWLANGLVRAFAVIVALYERVKARRRVLDQIDLLLKLRDLLRDDPGGIRAEYQRLFEHVLIDEFQDTDPLQAEIVAFLCDDGTGAKRWDETRLKPGKLTIVGDPKQSIYRFRRADVSMYDAVRRQVLRGKPLVAPLVANFRSRPSLIEFFNDRFRAILGEGVDGALFDPASGCVFHQELAPGRSGVPVEPRVHVVPLRPAGTKAEAWRRLEAEALGRYLTWLVDGKRSGVTVTDPTTEEERAVRYGDIAVLAISTTNLPLLFTELDAARVPWTARGGKLFLEDPLHRRFFLALRALADRDDGAAEATLLRPPFFALDPADHLAARAAGKERSDGPSGTVRAARELVSELRRRRFERSPGTTARDLLERTAFARAVALSPNGEQRLVRLRELCSQIDRMAAVEGVDFDGVSAWLREWADDPVQLDPPSPVGAEAVQVMSVHQAKGLEFPVVVLWDCRAQVADRYAVVPPWAISPDGQHWMVSIAGLSSDSGQDFKEREEKYRDSERLRVVYVATTRARDLLVLPLAGDNFGGTLEADGRYITGRLVKGAPPATLRVLDTYDEAAGASWAKALPLVDDRRLVTDEKAEAALRLRWSEAAAEAAAPRFQPRGVSHVAHELVPNHEDETESPVAARPVLRREGVRGRFGPVFGETVHQAIGHAVGGLAVKEAVRRAASQTGLSEHLADAERDVERALAALKGAGLLPAAGVEVRLEYPIAGAGSGGVMLVGFVDLLAADAGGLTLVDFKTDPPVDGPVESAYPAYVAQLRGYAELLAPLAASADKPLRTFLLFTASGGMVEVGG